MHFLGGTQFKNTDRPTVSRVVSLFLLSQIFLIVHHKSLMHAILRLLINLEENQVMAVASQDEAADNDDNITDEEKELRMTSHSFGSSESCRLTPHLETILDSLSPTENDYEALFGLSLLYAIGQNKGTLSNFHLILKS